MIIQIATCDATLDTRSSYMLYNYATAYDLECAERFICVVLSEIKSKSNDAIMRNRKWKQFQATSAYFAVNLIHFFSITDHRYDVIIFVLFVVVTSTN